MEEQATNSVEVWTIGRLLEWTAEYLSKHGVDEARLSAEVLLAHAAGCRRIDLYARFDQTLNEDHLSRFRDWVRRAAAHEPIGYLVEEKEFFSLPFRVTPDVLIPRPETEVLVECAIDHCIKAGLDKPRLLDLGTGSGCIAIALLVQLSGSTAVATDISAAALDVARANAERHKVSDRLTLIEADGLALPNDILPEDGFDLLLSNPPYVAADAVEKLDACIRQYEPLAAISDGGDGLSFYRQIAVEGPRLLADKGVVIVEAGDGQAATVIHAMEEPGGLAHEQTRKDRTVGQQRVLMFVVRPATLKA
jgi:release factor glutamine methyltransferase